MIAFFFTLFEGYKCNRMYEITPKETKVLMGREKTNFSDHELQLTNWNLTHEVTEDLTATSLAWENSWHLATRPLVSRAAKWRRRNERWNSILITRHCPDLGSASDWLNQISHAARPIRSTAQLWIVTRHQYGISALFVGLQLAGKPVVASPNVGCFLSLPHLNKALQRLLFFVLADKSLSTWSLSSVPEVAVTLMALEKCQKECNEA